MKRNKTIVILAHCILNGNAKVDGLCTYSGAMPEVVSQLLGAGIGMVQLPCPEMHLLGSRRWGIVKDQIESPMFRERIREQLKETVHQLVDYHQNGYRIVGLVGIDGSPSCGLGKTCRSSKWQGDFIDLQETADRVKTLQMVEEPGVMMEELLWMLKNQGIEPPVFAVDEEDYTQSAEQFKHWVFQINQNY